MRNTFDISPDTALDLRVRAELALAFDAHDAPAALFRQPPPLWRRRIFQKWVLALVLTGGGSGAVLAMRPPALVRGVIDHEYHERTLRGSFMEPAPLLAQLGLTGRDHLPGAVQMMRPCDVNGQLAYHLTTFFEKGGMVTVFAFDQPVALAQSSGWWANVHWKVIRSSEGKPLVLVSEKKSALAVAQRQLGAPPG